MRKTVYVFILHELNRQMNNWFSKANTGGVHRAGGGKVRLNNDPSRTLVISYSKEWRSPGWRRKGPSLHTDPSRTRTYFFYSQVRRSPGWRRKGPSLHTDPSRTTTYFFYSQVRRSPGWRRKGPSQQHDPSRTRTYFLFSGEALTRLEAERSVSPH